MIDPRRLLSRSGVYSRFRQLVSGRDTAGRLAREFLRIAPGERVLDIGCGPGDILATLPEGIDYFGFDNNPAYIEAARARFGNRGTFEVRSVSPEAMDEIAAFDVVIAIGVVHHLTDQEARTLFAGAAKALKPDGRLVTFDGAFVKGQNPIARLLLKLDRGRHVRSPEAYVALAEPNFESVEPRIVHDLLAVPYTHIIMEARRPVVKAA
jgi:cyclopropane fatty-acyl-phospholipid synthase-like methyltransferase